MQDNLAEKLQSSILLSLSAFPFNYTHLDLALKKSTTSYLHLLRQQENVNKYSTMTKRLKDRWKVVLVYWSLGLNIATKKHRLSLSGTFGGEITWLQGWWKAILLLCFLGTKNSSCWAGGEAELQSFLLLLFLLLSVPHTNCIMHHLNEPCDKIL